MPSACLAARRAGASRTAISIVKVDLQHCVQAYAVGIRPRSAQSRREQNRDYYNWRDLAVGESVMIFGRAMLLTDADEFTREWYKAKAGAMDCDFEPVQVHSHPVAFTHCNDLANPHMHPLPGTR